MGTIAACECCLLRDKWDGDTTSPEESATSDSGQSVDSSSSSSTSSEARPLKKKKRKKSKRSRKRRKKRKRDSDPASIVRNESYFSPSDDEEDEGYYKRNRNKSRKKHKKYKKKKRHNESPLVEDIQRELMEKSQNEIEKTNNEDSTPNMIGLYGMDVKTMELLMSVGDLGQNPPQPPMPSLPSNPIESVEYEDTQVQMPPIADDMSNQLKSYNSEVMYGSVPKQNASEEEQESYDDLIVDHDDTTPALPQVTGLTEEQTRSLGGLDYDFAPDTYQGGLDFAQGGFVEAIDEQEETKEESGSMEKGTTLREAEKNLSFSRIKKTLAKNPDEIHAMISAQYTHKSEQEDLETDDSSYDAHEIEEIERLKSGTRSADTAEPDILRQVTSEKVLAAKLIRPGTVTNWEHDDLDAMHTAMSKQIEAMKKQSSMGQGTEDEFETDEDEEADMVNDTDIDNRIAIRAASSPPERMGTKKSQLFRIKSTYKWDTDRLDQENEDMQAQLASLVMAHQQISEQSEATSPNVYR